LEDDKRDRNKDKGDKGNKDKGGSSAPGAPPGGAGGGGLSGGFSGKPKGGDTAGNKDDEASRKKRIALTNKLKRIDSEITKLEAEVKSLAPDAATSTTTEEVAAVDLNSDAPILVWAHDINAKPGATYRYRCVLRIYNPFFAHKRQMVKDQAPLADGLAMNSIASDWSKPVDVTPPVAFFVTRTNPNDGPLSLGSAVVEVYRLYDGKWRMQPFTVAPGDRIGRKVDLSKSAPRDAKERDPKEAEPEGAAAAAPLGEVDFSTEWFVVDIVEDLTADRKGLADGAKPAVVILERLGEQRRIELREPTTDMNDPDRRRLNRDWKLTTTPA
jgi:hypothetical protein